MNRRDFLKGLVATAAGVLIPGDVDPAKKIYALDSTMIPRGRGERAHWITLNEVAYPTTDWIGWIDALEPYDVPLTEHIAGQFSTKGWFSEGEPDRYRVYIEYPKIVQFQEIYGQTSTILEYASTGLKR